MAATITRSQVATVSGTTNTWTGFSPAVGDVEIIAASVSSTTNVVSGISGGGVTTWNFLGAQNAASGGGNRVEIWWGVVTSAGAANPTVTYSGSQTGRAKLWDISGVRTDVTPVANFATSTTSVTFSCAGVGAIAISTYGSGFGPTVTPGSPWTDDTSATFFGFADATIVTSPLGGTWSATPFVAVGSVAVLPLLPPDAPVLSSVTPAFGQNVLVWTTPATHGAAITGYQILRATTSGAETNLTTVGLVNTYTDTGLTSGTTYFYEVQAITASTSNSVSSNELFGLIPAAPTAPTTVLEVSWTTSAFAAPVWVDCSAFLLSHDSKRGRQYELNENDTGTATVVVDNSDGRFTPELASGAYFPNVLVNKQIRVSAVWSGVTYRMFTGFITAYSPSDDTALNYSEMTLTCVDAFNFLGLLNVPDAYAAEILQDKPVGLYQFGEAAGSTAGDTSGNSAGSLSALIVGAGTVTFGTATEAVNAQTGAGFTAPTTHDGATLAGYGLPSANIVAFQMQSTQSGTLLPFLYSDNNLQCLINTGGSIFVNSLSLALAGTKVVNDGLPHFIVVASVGTTTSLFIDGVLQGTGTNAALNTSQTTVYVGSAAIGTPPFFYAGSIWGVARLASVNLTDTLANRVTAWYQGSLLYPNESEVARLTRYARYSGLGLTVTADAALSTFQADIGTAGQTYTSAIQAVVDDVNGDVFVGPDGALVYKNRQARYNAASLFTFADSAGTGVEASQLVYDDTLVIDQIVVARTNGATQTVQSTTVPLHPANVTLNVATDNEAVDFANWRLALFSTPHTRCDSVTISPTAQTSGSMWVACLSLLIQGCITLGDMPSQAPASSLLFFIESVEVTVMADGATPTWIVTFGLSPQSFIPLVMTLDSASFGLLNTDCLGY